MNRDWQTYGETEYTLRVSLRSRPDRNICVFRIDSIVGQGVSRTVFLDRAVTPVPEETMSEWADALDNILAAAVERRYGVQLVVDGLGELRQGKGGDTLGRITGII